MQKVEDHSSNSGVSRCFVADGLYPFEREGVRSSVCKDLQTFDRTGTEFCALHFPDKEKYPQYGFRFDEIIASRIENGDTDFSFTVFSEADFFFATRFVTDAFFVSAVFNAFALFNDATFEREARFGNAKFLKGASFGDCKFNGWQPNFWKTEFYDDVSFISAIFESLTSFEGASFLGDADFSSAKFNAPASFRSVSFSGSTKFENAEFNSDKRTSFFKAKFEGDTFFDSTTFKSEVSFNSAVFGSASDLIFRNTIFNDYVSFRYATSAGYLRFISVKQNERSRMSFEEAAFEKASRVSFHTLFLHPYWFINVDPKKFVFTEIEWRNLYWDFQGINRNIQREIESLNKIEIIEQARRLLSIATRQLAVNAEENNYYEDASKFRYMSMETRRLEDTKRLRASRLLTWLYKWTSGYGESWSWASLVLLTLWLFFGIAYWGIGDFGTETSLDFFQGLGHSSNIMLFQKPDLKANSNLTFTLRIVQTILSPLQAALLALAIRRKFMR